MKSADGDHIIDPERQETREQQADRNWSELLQEMRVMETGTQILAGFLFTLPFQQRFGQLDDIQRIVYLILVILAAVLTVLLLTPIGLHRTLFRQRLKHEIVERSAVIVRIALIGAAVLAAGTASLVFDVVVGRAAGITVLLVLLIVVGLLWLAYPALVGRKSTPNGVRADAEEGS
ncbi:sodium:proton antiporter [Paeniglutamicibacter antarcticus]|uniref:Sodium:proton antiporter n=2 Tax=Arthrobacter terrae TaxID=2935737 RepID=A0A931CJC8_9MICC|nr:sodium:proton antiporter [Arthrobacter terrae]